MTRSTVPARAPSPRLQRGQRDNPGGPPEREGRTRPGEPAFCLRWGGRPRYHPPRASNERNESEPLPCKPGREVPATLRRPMAALQAPGSRRTPGPSLRNCLKRGEAGGAHIDYRDGTPTLSDRSHRRRMATDRAAAATILKAGPAPQRLVARHPEWNLLQAAHGLPVAVFAPRHAQMENRVSLLSALAEGTGVDPDSRPVTRAAPCGPRARGPAECRHH